MPAVREIFVWLTGQSLASYIVRGVLAIAVFTAGLTQINSHPAFGMALMFSALIPLGGCPGCWIGGIFGAACAYRPKRHEPPQE